MSRGTGGYGAGGGSITGLAPPPIRQLQALQFSMMSPEWVRAMSGVEVNRSSTTEKQNHKNGVNDHAMGPADRGSRCVRCHATMDDCVGHGGHIKLEIPVLSPFFIEHTMRAFQVVCICCGRELFELTPKVRAMLLAMPSHKRLDAAKKLCPKALYCGQLQRAREQKHAKLAAKAAAQQAKLDARAAKAAAAAAAKKGALLARASGSPARGASRSRRPSASPAPTRAPSRAASPRAGGGGGGGRNASASPAASRSSRGKSAHTNQGEEEDADGERPKKRRATADMDVAGHGQSDDEKDADSSSEGGEHDSDDSSASEDDEETNKKGASSGTESESEGEDKVKEIDSGTDTEDAEKEDGEGENDSEPSSASESEGDSSASESGAEDSAAESGDEDGEGGGARRRRAARKRRAPTADAKKKGKPGAAKARSSLRGPTAGRVSAAAARALHEGGDGGDGSESGTDSVAGESSSVKAARRSSARTVRQYAGDFDPSNYKLRGCGAPVPRLTREGQRLFANFTVPFTNNLSKHSWPVFNTWRMYEALRAVPEDLQEVLGLSPQKGSPACALMIHDLHVPPRIVRYKKEKENGKGGAQDDNTQAIRDVVLRSQKLRQKLSEDKITRYDQLGSVNRNMVWFCPPRTTICTCAGNAPQNATAAASAGGKPLASPRNGSTPTTMPKSGAKKTAGDGNTNHHTDGGGGGGGGGAGGTGGRKGGCTCAAAGRFVACDERFCTDKDWCTCIPRDLLPPNQELSPRLKALYKEREAAEARGVPISLRPTVEALVGDGAARRNGGSGGSGNTGATRQWSDYVADLEGAITTYLIGDINKKGAGRKDGRPGLSPWAGTTSNSNSLVKRDRAFAARFVGKHGRIRGTMYGKRCDKTARTVASGDIALNVGQIGVPREIAETLTVCEQFQAFNRAKMIDRMRNNKLDYVMMPNGDLFNTRFLNRDYYVVPNGATCERHIESGDPVVWNRQPTLHKPSIEGADAVLLNYPANSKRRRTLAINQSMTTPTNADFDGDEFNMHLSKGQASRAETTNLMSAPQQIRSQQGDSVIVVLVQNARLALHLLTDTRTCFTRGDFQQLMAQFGRVSHKPHIQRQFERAIFRMPKPKSIDPATGTHWYTGLQLVSAMLPPKVFYGHVGKKPANDGDLEPALIVNSEMISGRLGGNDVCHGVSGNLLHTMVQDVGEEVTVAWMSGFQRVLNSFLMRHGATMAPADYALREEHQKQGREIVERATRWCHAHASKEGGYDMRRSDVRETRILDVLNRSRALYETRLRADTEQREKYGWRRNGVLDLIQSGAKGKMPHLVQMGAIVGQQMPGRGRVIGNVAHFNQTQHLPETHGYVAECYRDGLRPWSFYCAAIGGREGLVHTGSSTPRIGYFQKRLGTNMSDLHARADGTVRDCRDQIVQWRYGDDALDPSHLESNEAKFVTPWEHASPILRNLQAKVLRSRAALYDTTQAMPANFLAPLNLARLFRRATTLAPKQPSGQPQPGTTTTPTTATPTTTTRTGADARIGSEEVEGAVAAWVRVMERENLLRARADPRCNVMLDAMLHDALSPWNVAGNHRFTWRQLEFVLRELERALARSALAPGEAVGPIASQSMGEPATQSTLNQFHFAGAQNTQQLVVNRLDDTANACKKPATASMTVLLRPEWASRREDVERIARDIKELRLVEFVTHVSVHAPDAPIEASHRGWVASSLALQPARAQLWFRTQPRVRIELDAGLCRDHNMSLVEAVTHIHGFYKLPVATVTSGSYSPRWTVYLALGSGTDAMSAANRVFSPLEPNHTEDEAEEAFQAQQTALATTESAALACLHELSVRGLPRVTDAMVVALETRYYDPVSRRVRTRSCCPQGTSHIKDCPHADKPLGKRYGCGSEWAIVTMGSNFDGLLTLPAVHFERCSTSYVHDVQKLLGVEASRRWLDETFGDLVRRSRVDCHHTKLLADVMTRGGGVTPMTRNGLKSATDSVCRLLFENVLDNIKTAGVFAQADPLRGVPESILMGIPAAIGTGAVALVPAPAPAPDPHHNNNPHSGPHPNPDLCHPTIAPSTSTSPMTPLATTSAVSFPSRMTMQSSSPNFAPHSSHPIIAAHGGDDVRGMTAATSESCMPMDQSSQKPGESSLSDLTAVPSMPKHAECAGGVSGEMVVRWGTRKVPCRTRPFRFFQMLTAVGRDGRFAPSESRAILRSTAPNTVSSSTVQQQQQQHQSLAVASRTSSSVGSPPVGAPPVADTCAPLAAMAPALAIPRYSRVARWSGAAKPVASATSTSGLSISFARLNVMQLVAAPLDTVVTNVNTNTNTTGRADPAGITSGGQVQQPYGRQEAASEAFRRFFSLASSTITPQLQLATPWSTGASFGETRGRMQTILSLSRASVMMPPPISRSVEPSFQLGLAAPRLVTVLGAALERAGVYSNGGATISPLSNALSALTIH
jgi:DNA-directed RNA polymerase beta' subunit